MHDDHTTFAEHIRNGTVAMPEQAFSAKKNETTAAAANQQNTILPPDSDRDVSAYGEQDHYQQNGVSTALLKQLRNADTKREIDLHGLTVAQAYETLEQSLQRAIRHGEVVLTIIHGRGTHSPDGVSIIRNKTRYWLQNCPQVLAYVQPHNTGCVKVLLRSKKR